MINLERILVEGLEKMAAQDLFAFPLLLTRHFDLFFSIDILCYQLNIVAA